MIYKGFLDAGESFIYQLIYSLISRKSDDFLDDPKFKYGTKKFVDMLKMLEKLRLRREENPLLRFPTLETVLMVEEAIEKYSGEVNRTELWKKLPKKVMWQTYLIVLDYLLASNKIIVDPRDEKIVWIWNPKLVKMLEKRKRY